MTLSESQSVPNSIEQLIAELGDKLDLTGEQIADVLWLTLELQKFESSSSGENLKSHDPEKDTLTGSLNQPIALDNQAKPTNQSTNSTFSNQTSTTSSSVSQLDRQGNNASVYPYSGSGESQGLKIGVPDAPSLREPLTLAHALRPLMRRVATGRKLILDEAATVQRIAKERICIPVLRAEPEPWLDLTLVIDESHSMLIWGHTIQKLKEILKKYGIFRDIRVWALQPDEAGENLQLFSRMGSNKRLTEPKEIIDPTGRRLILIVSDCVSNIWRKGMLFPVLKAWTQKQPLAILQMLPEWMWRRTALDLGTAVGFKSSIIGAANQQLSLHKPLRRSRSIGFKVEERSKIPVITLDPEKVAQWSQMLVGKADALVPGYLLPPELEIEDEIEYPSLQREQNTLDAAERVQNFRMTTSPLGRELAGLLAASPVINLPVVRLIQESLLPKSNQVQVAEVFLGGLLQPKSASLEKLENEVDNKTDVNPDLVEYQFIEPKIRDLFLDDAPVSDSIDVVNAVSRYVAEQLRVSLSEFMAILKAPQKIEEQQREDTIKPFAKITARVLRKLGGQYTQFAEELENNITKNHQFSTRKSNSSNFYALLIGIDFYPSGISNLTGCVRDINQIEKFLITTRQTQSENIWKLTASWRDTNLTEEKPIESPEQLPTTEEKPIESPEQLPTYVNIIQKFRDLTEIASAGDQIYIHYSGHGRRIETIAPEIKGQDGMDECLELLTDIGNSEDKYLFLRDTEFTEIIQNMLDRGLIVTITLDCSHSGGLIETSWLSGNYIFLSSCNPTEASYDYAFEGKNRMGALTYWFLDTLQQSTQNLTYKNLYNIIYSKIKEKFLNQTPMLFGEGNRFVFSTDYLSTDDSINAVTVIQVDVIKQQIILNVGLAQGLMRGTRFALFPVGSDFTDKQQRLAVVEITELQASTATAKILSTDESGVSAIVEKIEPGLPAVMESAPVGLKHRVRLHLKQVGNKEEQLPQNLADKQAAALEKVRQAMQGNGWVTEVAGDEEAHYQVAVGREREYEICIGMPIKNLRPVLSVEDPEAPKKVVDRLVHLTKYHSVQVLDNPFSELSNKLEVDWLGKLKDYEPGDPIPSKSELSKFTEPNNLIVEENEWIFLSIKNNHSQPLNLVVISLKSDWSVSQIYPKGNFITLSSHEEQKLGFQLFLSSDYEKETTNIQIFATLDPPYFRFLELPPLD